MRIPFGLQSYQHTSLPLSAQRMVNCYLESAPPRAKTDVAVIGSYGVLSTGTVGSGSHRGAIVIRGTLYVVNGTGLYRVASTYAATLLGTIPGTGPVFMAGDETNILIVTDPDGYYWNGTAVAQITDVDWPGAVWCGYLDGYFIIIAPDSGQFYITANRNPSSIDALDFASAERYPDDLVTGVIDKGEFVGLGTESGEGFYNSGATDFPITKISNADIERGCVSVRGAAKADNTVCFIGSDGKVYRLNGWAPQVISTPAIEQAIAATTDKNFVTLVWDEPGHSFVAFKNSTMAFVFDVSTSLWYERASYGHDSWRWAWVVRCYNQWIVGDAESNAIGVLDANTFTEFGATMRAEVTSPAVGRENEFVKVGRVELVFEQGVGLATGQGSNPQAMFQISGSGGRTWTSERWRSLGVQGDFGARATWFRNGRWRDPVFRYAITDPVRRNLMFATAEVA